jgi:hypothetical protein
MIDEKSIVNRRRNPVNEKQKNANEFWTEIYRDLFI